MPKPLLLLFDLGGVLVEFSGIEEIQRQYLTHLTVDEIRRRLAASVLMTDFQCGRVTAQDFGEAFVTEWELPLTVGDFLHEFESWTKCLYPGSVELLQELRKCYRLAALSNSNELHWRRNNELLGVDRLFEQAFSSHQMGVEKPDPEVYRIALRELAVLPNQAIFFDDVLENVRAALEVGIEAHHVVGIEELRACITKLGLL